MDRLFTKKIIPRIHKALLESKAGHALHTSALANLASLLLPLASAVHAPPLCGNSL